MKMSVTKRKIQGLQNIRTHTGLVDHVSEPHRAFLRVGVLEMEKARRKKERESAMRRVSQIDTRVGEIEKEKASLLNRVAGIKDIKTLNTVGNKPRQPSAAKAGNFKIRY